MPSAHALTSEFVSPRRRSVVATVMMSGVPIGGSIAAVVGIVAIPALGWQSMYLFAFSGVVLLALIVALLPESPSLLRAHGRLRDAVDVERRFGVAAVEDAGPRHRPGFRTILRLPSPRLDRPVRAGLDRHPARRGTAWARGCRS